MLKLDNICKTYKVGEIETKALRGISVAFREREFVAILGPSGSGKTTCLNIIGGLDRYDSGDLIIKGKKTKNFKDADWDAYRNNSIGFVFQNYNLINHLSIVTNVELAMTLSGVSYEEKHRRALEVLKKVGLGDHLHKKPNQLSGGQMQRVAIARALANDPEILLCDEPTGALDTATSVQILNLIKEVAAERLVIMVTHNPSLSEKYADRIIKFEDGLIISDTHPHEERPKDDMFKLIKTNMKFTTALNLSWGNIKTKKGRTFLTSFASSIGIIGIALILSLSTGFKIKIDEFQRDSLAEFPIIITRSSTEVDYESMRETRQNALKEEAEDFDYGNKVYLYNPSANIKVHQNDFGDEFMTHIKNIDTSICDSIGYTRFVPMNLIRKTDDGVIPVSIQTIGSMSGDISSMNGIGLASYPNPLIEGGKNYVEKNYNLLAGSYPKELTDLTLLVDERNRLDYSILEKLGYKTKNDDGSIIDTISFEDIIGTEIKIVSNNDYYKKTDFGNYIPSTDYDEMYASEECITLTITGIAKPNEDVLITMLSSGIVYNDNLTEIIINNSKDSEVLKAQMEADYNIMTMEEIKESDKNDMITYFGGNSIPFMIFIYPTSFENKEKVINYIDEYNDDKDDESIIVYTDLAESISDLSSSIMDGITIVLIAFASISLVVSLIMISIITYTSVLERTKEIGILKALGARKKDITRVFDAETCILGIFSGTLGVILAWLMTFPANYIINNMTKLDGVANLQILHAIGLVLLSTILTMLGGHIPARMASKKDAVEALRSE